VLLLAIILSPFIEEKRWPMSAWFQTPTVIHDPPTAEDIEKAIAPTRAERDSAVAGLAAVTKERDDAQAALRVAQATSNSAARVAELEAKLRQLEVQQIPLIGAPLGPQMTMSMIGRLGAQFRGSPMSGPQSEAGPVAFHWAVLITGPREDEDTPTFLRSLFSTAGLDVRPLPVADHAVNLDAPEFPKPGNAGITLHGDDALSKQLLDVLQPCLIVRQTSKTADRFQEWYGPLVEQDRKVVWIEIGNGSPWTRERRCWK
jgi:hypothetical protein